MKNRRGLIAPLLTVIALTLPLIALIAGCDKQQTAWEPNPAEGQSSLKPGGSDSDDWALGAQAAQIPFSQVQLFVENNATANDAGIQVFFDAEGWKQVKIFNPGDLEILDITTRRGFRDLGLTEVRFESEEPSLSEVLALFPAGEYDFQGRTTDGQRLEGTATFSHSIPGAPSFTPSQGEIVDPNNVNIVWERVSGAERYQVIVENDDIGVNLTADLLDPTSSMRVPPTFLARGTEYKVEVLAISENLNRTITEGTFNTSP